MAAGQSKRRSFPLAGLVLVVVFGHLTACGGARTPSEPTIEDLRNRAADDPDDPDAQRELAMGEMFMEGGDPERIDAQVGRALRLSPDDDRLHLLAGLFDDLHGQPRSALGHYLDAVELASRSDRAEAPFVAEVAMSAVEDLEDLAPGFVETVRPRLTALVAAPGRMGVAARHTASEVLVGLAYRRGDMDAVRRLAASQGCVPQWRVAGPFGPRQLLGFDEPHEAEAPEPLLASYDLGPGRGVRETRELEARGCSVHLGGGPIALGGTTFAEAVVDIPQAGHHVVRLETPNAVQLFIDGEQVVRLDARVEPTPRVSFHRLRLSAGRHELTAKITTRHPNPIILLSVMGDDGRAPSEGAGASPFYTGRPQRDGVFSTYLRGAVALSRGDAVAAREVLRRETRGRGASPALLQLRAAAALSDPLLPADMRRDEARRLLRLAARRDPAAWYPALQLARLEAADGRLLRAVASLREAGERWPEMVNIPLQLTDYFLGRGWYGQADQTIERARQVAPDACRPVRAAIQSAERRHRIAEVNQLVERLLSCDARSNARFQSLLRRRDWDGATAEIERLSRLEPRHNRYGLLAAATQVARGRGDAAAVRSALEAMAELQPGSVTTRLAQTDWLLAHGEADAARTFLTDVIEAEPQALLELRLLKRSVGASFALSPFRLDGARVLREFEQSGRTYDEPEVLVLDYTVVRVFEDGSSLELTHNIWRVQSDEAVDNQGEFHLPPGAQLLRLHTIKADGRRIEPDEIEGKDTLSLPNLAPGDYVEYEYANIGDPPTGFPGGFLGSRFYFRSFETPYDLSQLTVVFPSSMEPLVDPRGPAPPTEESVEGDLKILRFTRRESRPLPAEPMSVAPREFIPSVNVGVGATWDLFIESLRDALADRDVRDPGARREALQILGDERNAPPLARAQRLYEWILDNVEQVDDAFGLSPAMLAERTGNRARILHYMLGLVGIESQLVLVRSKNVDATPSEIADTETYQYMLVMLGEGEQRTLVYTRERGAPFGYVPPVLRGQDAIVLGPGAERIVVPRGEPGADRRTVQLDARLRMDGSATVHVVERFIGSGAIRWRAELEAIPNATLQQRFEESYVSRLVAGAALTSLNIRGREDPDQPLIFEYDFEVRSLGRRQGNSRVISGLFPTRLTPTYARIDSRETTQLLAQAVDLEVTIRIVAPESAALPEPPGAVDISGPNGALFNLASSRDGQSLTSTRRVYVPSMRVTPDQYPDFAAFCRQADQAEDRDVEIRF